MPSQSEPIEIIDLIDHRNKYGIQSMIVVNRYPRPLFERRGSWLIGNDGCIFKFYHLERVNGPSHWKAFGGREFDIPMADGTVEHANGQWWDKVPSDYSGLIYDYGVSTIEELQRCYVFMGGLYVDREAVDAWRADNSPSNNYHKYDMGHKDYEKQTIVSPWETEACTK